MFFFTINQILNRKFKDAKAFQVKLFLNNPILLDNSLSKTQLIDQFTPWEHQSWCFRAFRGKPDPERVIFRTKNNFWIEDFEKRVRSWINFLTTHQILKWLWFSKKQIWWKSSFQKITFGCFYTVRTPKFVAMRFSKRMILGKKIEKKRFEMMTFEKNQILKLLFQQRYRFSIKIFETRQIFSQLYTTQQTVNRGFHRVSGFEMKSLQRIRLWSEKNSFKSFKNELECG